MYYYLVLLTLIALFSWLEYSERKNDFLKAKLLNKEFNDWVRTTTDHKRPSNALFTELYRKRYGKEEHPQDYLSLQGDILKQNTADIIASFPTKHPVLFETEQAILDNLESYYELEFEKAKDISFWMAFIVSVPVKILKHIGINEDHLLSRLIQVIFWIISLLWLPIRSLILEFIDVIIRNKIS